MSDQLDRVRVAAHKAAAARERLHLEIRDAREQGQPLRAIAAAAAMNHETVRTIANTTR